MKYTNNTNLPEPLFRAVCNDPYNPKSDFTVTGLIKPPRIAALEKLHKDELVEDAADRIWSLMGQIGHLVLERAGMKGDEYVEQRHTVTRYGFSISGQVDLWRSSILIDYKFTSIWSVKDGVKPEWEQQCNLNHVLCRANGIEVREAQIVAIFRDWSVGEARRNRDYPQTQVQVLNVPLWSEEDQEDFLKERIEAHDKARKAAAGESADALELCSPTDRWLRPEKWAVMKKGAAKAYRLYDEQHDAHACVASMGPAYVVERRPAVQTRCLDYCAVAQWCEQFKANDPSAWAERYAK